MIRFNIITIFPEAFDSYFNSSLLKKAQEKGLIKINFINPRDFTTDKHKTVDERPFGGGPGMVMKIEPIFKAVKAIQNKIKGKKARIILFSVKGKKFEQKTAERLAKYQNLIMICGHYEGIDERTVKYIADEEISIGDYVLTGGEIPAMILVDAVSRLIPGVLGKEESIETKRWQKEFKGELISCPVYSRPAVFYPEPKNQKKKWLVPKVLLSGDHKKIKEWRRRNRK